MPSNVTTPDGSSDRSRFVVWLRLLKLVFSILLLAIGILEALARLGLT